MDYLRDPAAIYEASFATVRREADLGRLPDDLHPVALRIAHACGMVDVIDDLAFSTDIVAATSRALRRGCTLFCDCRMVEAGIIMRNLPAGCATRVTLDEPGVHELATEVRTTRSAAAITFWRDDLGGSVVVIGNAPTALFRLLEGLDENWPKPAAILALPVGFVGATESKAALAADSRGVPFLTLRGRRGGSAMAAAAVNAIASVLRT